MFRWKTACVFFALALGPAAALADDKSASGAPIRSRYASLIWVDRTAFEGDVYQSQRLFLDPRFSIFDEPTPGQLSLSKIHIVPIRLYPSTAYSESIFTIVVDGVHGSPSFRAQFGGSGFSGGAAGHARISRRHELRGEVINTPILVSVQLYDDIEVYYARVNHNTNFIGLTRIGAQVWRLPLEAMVFGSAQAGFRLEKVWGTEHNRFRFDVFVGPGGYHQIASDKTNGAVESSSNVELLY